MFWRPLLFLFVVYLCVQCVDVPTWKPSFTSTRTGYSNVYLSWRYLLSNEYGFDPLASIHVNLTSKTELRSFNFSISTTFFRAQNLSPLTLYNVSLLVINTRGVGPTTAIPMVTSFDADDLDIGFQIATWVCCLLASIIVFTLVLNYRSRHRQLPTMEWKFIIAFAGIAICALLLNFLIAWTTNLNAYFIVNVFGLADTLVLGLLGSLVLSTNGYSTIEGKFTTYLYMGFKLLCFIGYVAHLAIVFYVGYIMGRHYIMFGAIVVRVFVSIIELVWLNEYKAIKSCDHICFSILRSIRRFRVPISISPSNSAPEETNRLLFHSPHSDSSYSSFLNSSAPQRGARFVRTIADHQQIPSKPPEEWSVLEAKQWCNYVGLTSYEYLFDKNSINGSLLINMEEAEIRYIGIVNPVHVESFKTAITVLKRYGKDLSLAPAPHGAGVSEVCRWIRSLGYSARVTGYFKDYAIHGAMLPRLTEHLLKTAFKMNDIQSAGLIAAIKTLEEYDVNIIDLTAVATPNVALRFWPLQTVLDWLREQNLNSLIKAATKNAIHGAALKYFFEQSMLDKAFNSSHLLDLKKAKLGVEQLNPRRTTTISELFSEPLVPSPIHEQQQQQQQKQPKKKKQKKQEQTIAVISEVDTKVDEDNMCGICFENQKEIAFKPCGHFRICRPCSEQITVCPWCKQRVQEKMRIFA